MTLTFVGFVPGHQTKLVKRQSAKMNTDSKDKMINDFSALLNEKHLSDVTFHFIDGSVLHAHKAVLIARSTVFSAMFLNKNAFEETRNGRVDISDIQSDVFFEMLNYLYTTRVPKIDTLAFELLMAAEKYDLQELKDMCEQELVENLDYENMLTYYELANKYNCSELMQESLEYMSNWASKKFDTMKRDPVALYNIINCMQSNNPKDPNLE